jgi:hypothetical protein
MLEAKCYRLRVERPRVERLKVERLRVRSGGLEG